MLTVLRLGDHTVHENSYSVDRKKGYPYFLLLLVQTKALFCTNDKWEHVEPDSAILFKNGQKHLYHGLEDENCYCDSWMHFESSTDGFGNHFPFGVPVKLHNPQDFYNLFHIINNEFYGASKHRIMTLNNLTTALIDKISDESSPREFPELYYRLSALREQLYAYPAKEWNINQIAEELNVSVGYFHQMYQFFFNTTCIGDVISSRINYASELLCSTGKSVEQIAELCGYHTVEHFIRQFRKRTGTSPSGFRKKN